MTLRPSDLANPRRQSGYDYVSRAHSNASTRPLWCATKKGRSCKHGTVTHFRGPMRRDPAEAAQDYCDYINGQPVATPATLKTAGHTYVRPKRVVDEEERAAWGVIRDRQAQRAGKQGYVYCISDGTAVKIGYSVNPQKRVAELQTGNPRQLVLLGMLKGTERAEKRLHRRFRADNILQEWFRPTDAVLSMFNPAPVAQTPEEATA